MTLFIEAKTANEAWNSALITLRDKYQIKSGKYFAESSCLFNLSNPELEAVPSKFPMNQMDMDVICSFMINGLDEDSVSHEWSKLYYKRITESPNSQLTYMIDKLKEDPESGRAVVSLWDKNRDQKGNIVPCTIYLWAKVLDKKLEFHVHARASDAYSKLLMNLNQFISIQLHIANELQVGVGKYVHFIDSCHIQKDDADIVLSL